MKLFILDNYDSFTYNLVEYFYRAGENCQLPMQITVQRNDAPNLIAAITSNTGNLKQFDAIVLSPGPGLPHQAGCLLPLIKQLSGKKPILGVCLGHQAIIEVYGGKLLNLAIPIHGQATPLAIAMPVEAALFNGIPTHTPVGRYHSWVAHPQHFPNVLQPTAFDADTQHIMAFKHKTLPVWGVQFHPESVLTPLGLTMLQNWLQYLFK